MIFLTIITQIFNLRKPTTKGSGKIRKQCIVNNFCKSLLVGSAPKPPKTRTSFCGCDAFLHQTCFLQYVKFEKVVTLNNT